MGSKIRLIDYNIRCADDGENRMIADRAPRLEALIREYKPDIVGLQEASRRWIDYLEEHLLDDYKMRFLYRHENSVEATPILWRKDKFNLIKEGHFWLSDQPEMPTKSFGERFYRICNWVLLELKETGERFLYVNTHMNGGPAATASAKLILKWMEARGAFTEYPALLTGDFNTTPASDCYKVFNESGKFKDLNLDLGFSETSTVNGYNEEGYAHDRIIDYVYYTPSMMKPLTYEVLNRNYYNGWISDHKGLLAEVELKEKEDGQ